jgi:chlorite dismutase
MTTPPLETRSPSITRVSFVAAGAGEWQVEGIRAICGPTLPDAAAVNRLEGPEFATPRDATWMLRGVRSNERYVARAEKQRLASVQEGLGRPASRRAALIPIRKSDAWWDLAQDERRAILEERSAHIAIGSHYLPAIARRLYHGRDLGEPFDFLTWFEFAPDEARAFDELLGRLRESEEWRYVVREVEVRLVKNGSRP